MTPYEIYLEFRTAPFGSESVVTSLYQASMFMGGALGASWKGATTLGTAISRLIHTYDPSLDGAIGGTVSNMIDQIGAAATELEAEAFVTRQRSLEDRRIVRVSLTAEADNCTT